MDKFICNKGFILTPSPSDNDVMVPYFIQVRDKDIIWSEDDFPSVLYNIAKSNEDSSSLVPVKELKFKKDGWNIKFQQDFTYEATSMISIGGSGFFTLNDTKNLLTGRIPLPFKSTCGYDNLSVICTLDAFDETLQSSVLTTKIDFSESIIKEFEVNLRNVLGEYSRRFYVEDSFEKSFISVSIKGKYVD